MRFVSLLSAIGASCYAPWELQERGCSLLRSLQESAMDDTEWEIRPDRRPSRWAHSTRQQEGLQEKSANGRKGDGSWANPAGSRQFKLGCEVAPRRPAHVSPTHPLGWQRSGRAGGAGHELAGGLDRSDPQVAKSTLAR